MDKFSFFGNINGEFVDELYQRYQTNKNTLEPSWRKFFDGYEFGLTNYGNEEEIPLNIKKEFMVIDLINAYRTRGHLFTKTNPVRERRKYSPTLDLVNYGLEEADLVTVFQAGEKIDIGPSTLNDIIKHLEETYCESIGIEYQYIRRPERVEWIRKNIELKNRPKLSVSAKKHILHKLNQSNVFEQFLQKKFVGQKRFSIEGGEALIPALDTLIEKGADLGVEEYVMGMAHRGRLNVLANIFNKTYEAIFSEFEGKEYDEGSLFDGDVKYHLGITSEVKTDSGKNVKITLAPNPSHLEAVDPIVQGITRSKIDFQLKGNSGKIIPILIHGDAAIAGQGIVYELIQMAQLDGYRTGGTLHIVVNNQVGFTTNYLDARSSTYCTDVAKTTLCPVFHVNGDDVEAVVQTMEIAIKYRQEFSRDVFIDLLCYRKYGHNEGDEPKFTQPKLYKLIAKHPNPREIYLKRLIDEKVISNQEGADMEKAFDDMLQDRLDEAKQIEKAKITNFLEDVWKDYRKSKEEDFRKSIDTGVDKDKLIQLGHQLNKLPEGRNYFRKIVKLFDDRLKMIEEDRLDWAMGELLAYATLLVEGHSIRISGQDVERGTFSHRHAILKVEDSEEEICLLDNICNNQGNFNIYNSHLSEYGVMGYEYGYSLTSPKTLCIWEAQFGDFSNGAQIMIDQYLSAAEDKWKLQNGLVLLLPHGYEGQGAEHSSARMERYLQLCAKDNMYVANCTTPSNLFHLLRRQMVTKFRKPLIIFTPKSLLRHPKAVSSVSDFSSGKFLPLIEISKIENSKIERLVFCSGKFYYDLNDHMEKNNIQNTILVRLEQLFPLPIVEINDVLEKYSNATDIVWAQEEPRNMGAWSHLLLHSDKFRDFRVASRRFYSSPSAGSSTRSKRRHNEVIQYVFDKTKSNN